MGVGSNATLSKVNRAMRESQYLGRCRLSVPVRERIDYAFRMARRLPRIYPILDNSFLPAVGRNEYLRHLGRELTDSGVQMLEYRNKSGDQAQLLKDAEILREAMPLGAVKLILDDRADLVDKIGFDGVHVDHGDMPPAEARALLGAEKIIGTLGGSRTFLPGVLTCGADYLSVGIVFPTLTKETKTEPIGVEGVRKMRELAGPEQNLVAIGGLQLDTALQVLDAGASIVAVAGAIFRSEDPAAEFRRWRQLIGE